MSYAYINDCQDDFVQYVCNMCPTPEKGRVRGIVLVPEDVTIQDPSDATEWANKVDLGEVFLVPNLSGSVTPTSVTSPGKGNVEEYIDGYDYEITTMDKNTIDACSAWVSVHGNKKFRVYYATGSLIWAGTANASIAITMPVEDDIKSNVEVVMTAKWFETTPICGVTLPENTFDTCITVV